MEKIISLFHSDLIFKPKRELLHLFWSSVARNVAISFLSLFSAVYVYEIFTGRGMESSSAVFMAVLFFMVLVISKQVFIGLSENLSQKLGFKGTMRLSYLPFFFSIASLLLAVRQPLFVFFAASFWGVHAGLFWWGYHGYFIKTGDSERFGSGIGEQEFLKTVALIIAPILGAFVIDLAGFGSSFILAGLFMIGSLMVLGKGVDTKQRHDIKYKQVIDLIVKHKSISLAYIGGGAEAVLYSLAWPLFLIFVFGEILDLGVIVSISLFLSAIVGVFVGDWIDKQGERKVIMLGLPIFAVSWIIRAISRGLGVFILADSMRHFGDKTVQMPLIELSYKKATEGYTGTALLFREIALGIGALLALIVFSFLVYFDILFPAIFIVSAAFSFLPVAPILKKRI